MSRERIPFQLDRPVYVKIAGLQVSGHKYDVGRELKWKEMLLDEHRIKIMVQQGMLYQKPTDESLPLHGLPIGDGLDALPLDKLVEIVEDINKVVTENTKAHEVRYRKCKRSNIRQTQIDLIRQWRKTWQDKYAKLMLPN